MGLIDQLIGPFKEWLADQNELQNRGYHSAIQSREPHDVLRRLIDYQPEMEKNLNAHSPNMFDSIANLKPVKAPTFKAPFTGHNVVGLEFGKNVDVATQQLPKDVIAALMHELVHTQQYPGGYFDKPGASNLDKETQAASLTYPLMNQLLNPNPVGFTDRDREAFDFLKPSKLETGKLRAYPRETY